MADGLAGPREHAEEVELDVRVRIDEMLDHPRRGAQDGKAELLDQLARERGGRRFAGLELAARKFPVAGVGLARRALRQQDAARGVEDDGGGNAGQRGTASGRSRTHIGHRARSARAPA